MTACTRIDTTSSSAVVADANTTTTTELLGKRKEPPLPSPTLTTNKSPPNAVVDTAFKRMFGYSWGRTFDLSNSKSKVTKLSSVESQMVQIFGPARTARILNLPWDVIAPFPRDPKTFAKDSYNPAAMATTKIVSASISMSLSSAPDFTLQVNSTIQANKRMRLEEIDYKKISLPDHMVSSSSVAKASAPTAFEPVTETNTNNTKANTNTSNLDSVLNQIAGKKQLNTVEKSNNDWEGFKETDKTLQDELERQAQGKNAYLVKQDFLNRVDQRTFELEKEGRDRERSRRTAESK